jgi:hypothetical protein
MGSTGGAECDRAELATAKAERGGKTIEVARVRITDSGRRALAGRPPSEQRRH